MCEGQPRWKLTKQHNKQILFKTISSRLQIPNDMKLSTAERVAFFYTLLALSVSVVLFMTLRTTEKAFVSLPLTTYVQWSSSTAFLVIIAFWFLILMKRGSWKIDVSSEQESIFSYILFFSLVLFAVRPFFHMSLEATGIICMSAATSMLAYWALSLYIANEYTDMR